jgi:hypothetical protein
MKRWGTILAVLLAVSMAAGAASQDLSAPPSRPASFAAPLEDPAGRVARQIADLVPTLPNLRARVAHGHWRLDDRARWSIRAERDCLDELRERGVRAEAFRTELTPIPTPVRIQSDIGGVQYRKRPGALYFIVSCELAVRLTRVAPIFRAHGIETIDVSSSWRRAPATSFHRMGLALDIKAFHGTRGTWVVEGQYPVDRAAPTCPVPAGAPPLRRLACELAASGHLSTVITPSYNLSHHSHFHIDVRPDDPRVFVR